MYSGKQFYSFSQTLINMHYTRKSNYFLCFSVIKRTLQILIQNDQASGNNLLVLKFTENTFSGTECWKDQTDTVGSLITGTVYIQTELDVTTFIFFLVIYNFLYCCLLHVTYSVQRFQTYVNYLLIFLLFISQLLQFKTEIRLEIKLQ